jgi:hypothetical protein
MNIKLNSVAVVRKRTIPTKRPQLVGEVNANFLRVEGVAWSAQRIPTAVNLFSRPEMNEYEYKILITYLLPLAN